MRQAPKPERGPAQNSKVMSCHRGLCRFGRAGPSSATNPRMALWTRGWRPGPRGDGVGVSVGQPAHRRQRPPGDAVRARGRRVAGGAAGVDERTASLGLFGNPMDCGGGAMGNRVPSSWAGLVPRLSSRLICSRSRSLMSCSSWMPVSDTNICGSTQSGQPKLVGSRSTRASGPHRHSSGAIPRSCKSSAGFPRTP